MNDMTNYEKLSEEVYNYVINEIYEGDRKNLITEIIENRGFGGNPWYSQIPDWVRELPLEFDSVILENNIFNELSEMLWELESKPYFEDISKTDYPEYYDGFNKPSNVWSDEEWEISWDYHTNSESINEVYTGIISCISTYIEEYILSKKSRKLYRILCKYISKEDVDYDYYEMTGVGDSFICCDILNKDQNLVLQVDCSCGSEGELSVEVELRKEDEYGFTEESYFKKVYLDLDKLDNELKSQFENIPYIEISESKN